MARAAGNAQLGEPNTCRAAAESPRPWPAASSAIRRSASLPIAPPRTMTAKGPRSLCHVFAERVRLSQHDCTDHRLQKQKKKASGGAPSASSSPGPARVARNRALRPPARGRPSAAAIITGTLQGDRTKQWIKTTGRLTRLKGNRIVGRPLF